MPKTELQRHCSFFEFDMHHPAGGPKILPHPAAKLAFRGLRSTAALASTPATANAESASSRRTAITTSEPMHDSAETLQECAEGVVQL